MEPVYSAMEKDWGYCEKLIVSLWNFSLRSPINKEQWKIQASILCAKWEELS